MKIAIDCANGAASELGPAVFRELGADITVINAEPDGRNINLHAGSTHPEGLQAAVVEITAKVGNSGRLFGAISAAAIADAVKEQLGQTIDRRRVIIASPIKAAGDYTVTVGLHSEVSANLRVRVIATK